MRRWTTSSLLVFGSGANTSKGSLRIMSSQSSQSEERDCGPSEQSKRVRGVWGVVVGI